MSLRRFYRTLTVDKNSHLDWEFISIPVPFSDEEQKPILKRFEDRNFQLTEIPPAALQFVIALMLSKEERRLTPEDLDRQRAPLTMSALRESLVFSHLELAEQIVAQPLLLFENSPLEVTSLGNLASETEFDGERARIYVANSESSSLLLVKHPRVFVIGGLADAFLNLKWRTLIHWVLN